MVNLKKILLSMLLFLTITIIAKSVEVNSLFGLCLGSLMCSVYTELVLMKKK